MGNGANKVMSISNSDIRKTDKKEIKLIYIYT